MGKRKLEIESKEEEKQFDHLRFTRRCKGLFKKAQELNVLCGSDIAVIVISNGSGKATTFGSPDLNSVINRYRNHNTTNGQSQPQNLMLARSDEQMIMNDGNQENMMMIEDLDLDLEPREDGSLPNLISSSSSYECGLDDDDYWLSLDVGKFLEEIEEEEEVNGGCMSERVLATGLMTEIPSSSSFSTIGCGADHQFAPSNGYGLGDSLLFDEFDPTFDVGQFLNEDGGGGGEPEQADEYGSVSNPISSSSSCDQCGFDDNDWLSLIDVNKFFEDEEFVRMWVDGGSDQY